MFRRSAIALAILAPCLSTSPAGAHEWYSAWCCNGDSETGDCQAIPESAVRATNDGWEITLKPGDHRLITKPHRFTKTYGHTRKSEDDQFHACLFPTEDTLRCFYAPPMGM